jgi:hypothetical protein
LNLPKYIGFWFFLWPFFLILPHLKSSNFKLRKHLKIVDQPKRNRCHNQIETSQPFWETNDIPVAYKRGLGALVMPTPTRIKGLFCRMKHSTLWRYFPGYMGPPCQLKICGQSLTHGFISSLVLWKRYGWHCWVGLMLLDSFVVWWWLLKLSTLLLLLKLMSRHFWSS